jgi:hypothetical protein
MDPLGDPLTTRPIQTGWEFTMEPYPSGQFGFIDYPDRQFGNGSVWTRIRTRSDGPEPFLTLVQSVPDIVGLLHTGGNENAGVCSSLGYLSSSSCHFVHILRVISPWTQNGPAITLDNHTAPHEWGGPRHGLALEVRSVCDTGSCFGISSHLYLSDLVHHGVNWVVPNLSTLCNHPTRLPTPSGWKCTGNCCHQSENSSLFALECL